MADDGSWDTIVVGQGLAGTTLAWHLIEAGQKVLLVDAREPVTSSKIAAGLMTPITGQRLALSWRIDKMLEHARSFYTRIELQTAAKFYHARQSVRLFKGDDERREWSHRASQPAYQPYLVAPQPDPLVDPEVADSGGGGFAMHAAQLDVAGYLDASRAHLNVEAMVIDWQHDIRFDDGGVTLRGQRARSLVSCEGFAARRNPYFSWVPFTAAKGDILTVRFQHPLPPVPLHRGIWLAPTAEPDVFRAGSSYDLKNLDCSPSAAARAEIECKLREFLRLPYTVIDHQAAVRPIIHESQALIGLHPQQPRLGFFNGLGSKGSLHAPWFAHCLADLLVHGSPIPKAINLQKLC